MPGKVLTDAEKKIANPDPVVVVNLLDGTEVTGYDDGGSVTPDGFFPAAKRQALYAMLLKESKGYDKSKPKERVFVLKEKRAPLFRGDPLANPGIVLNDEFKKIIEANVALRKQKLDDQIPTLKAEIKARTAKPAPTGGAA